MFAKIRKIGERGKRIAEKIYARSKRVEKPFVAVDCGLLSKELAASALFGHLCLRCVQRYMKGGSDLAGSSLCIGKIKETEKSKVFIGNIW